MVDEYKWLYNITIQYIGFIGVPFIKTYLKGKTAVSDHIINCSTCVNEKMAVNNI